MGRGKLPLKLIPKEKARRITFLKRRSGLIKKAYELSTLCDVKVCLIVKDLTNQPSNPIVTWPENPHKVKSLINDYKNAMVKKPPSKRLHTMQDFVNERLEKVNSEIEKLSVVSQSQTSSSSKSKAIVIDNNESGNNLSMFVLDNKIEELKQRMRHLIHLYDYNHNVQYYSPNDLTHHHHYFHHNHQMPWIYGQPSSQTVSFDVHNNNYGSFTKLLNSDDYGIDDQYYNNTNLLLEDQGDQHNNNINVLESGEGVEGMHQNDQNEMMLFDNPLMPLQQQNYNVSQPLLPLMPSSAAETTHEWHNYNQTDSTMGFFPTW
ncbi:agamous-like MADS-box protein AGL11 [Cannabis sativa]|uniref:agamous-like MADS-box protein AGL11 n=1 Tax=Cannabis sativa TaxID=3483 RepID=UPI0029CA21CF|nr:agamous-like MADS-box protein AGL11 [Cannabis sativa]